MVAAMGYEDMTNDQLSDELAERDLPYSGNKAELIARLEADDADKAIPDSEPAADDSEPASTSARPDAYAVEATTLPDGQPDSLADNPLPRDAATGDIVSQVHRGEVDGHTVTDVDSKADTSPGDVLVSVDPFVTIAKGEALEEMRADAGSIHKPQQR